MGSADARQDDRDGFGGGEVASRAEVLSAELGRLVSPGFEVFTAKAETTCSPDETRR